MGAMSLGGKMARLFVTRVKTASLTGQTFNITSVAILLISAYLFGILSHYRDIWPVPLLRIVQHSLFGTGIEYDEFHRLIGYPRKFSVPCPKQDAQTAVVLAIGQSNSANYGESNSKQNILEE